MAKVLENFRKVTEEYVATVTQDIPQTVRDQHTKAYEERFQADIYKINDFVESEMSEFLTLFNNAIAKSLEAQYAKPPNT